MLVFTKHKRCLILKDTAGKIIKIRLYSFTSGSLYDLIDEIHKRETEAISDERKAEVIRDSWDNERRFNVSSEDIIRSEWKKSRNYHCSVGQFGCLSDDFAYFYR